MSKNEGYATKGWVHINELYNSIKTDPDIPDLKNFLSGLKVKTLMYDDMKKIFFYKDTVEEKNIFINITIKNKEELTNNLEILSEINEILKSPTFSAIINNFNLIKDHALDEKTGGKRSKKHRKQSKKRSKKHHRKKRRRTKKYLR